MKAAPFRKCQAIFALLTLLAPWGRMALGETDHLEGYKIKDVNQVAPVPNPVAISNEFGSQSCELKKAQFFLVQSEQNGGDDARGGPPGEFVCYRAKCTGSSPPGVSRNSQFGLHALEARKAKLICLPVDTPQTCGNDEREGSEACDGTDAPACPNDCLSDCTCAAACPAGGGDSLACLEAALLASACRECCQADTACSTTCDAARPCSDGAGNDACAMAVNAAGCAAECCP